ncbi:MAG: DUF2723 domain-containing protein [Elusimicrobiota bacterium]
MLVFFITFIVYIYTLFPSCAPYRDTGEMVTAAHLLGVAHPPGYPFYVLLSKISLLLLSFGNEAYRLNVLSALAGAFTAYFLYRVFLILKDDKFLAGSASLLFSFSYLQWYLSLVSEMYTLNTLFAAAIIYLAFRLDAGIASGKRMNTKLFYLIFLLFGLGLGNRMDLLMLGAGLLWLLYSSSRHLSFNSFVSAMLFFAAGFTIFAYLPIRSSVSPFLDWNHPASLDRLWGSLTRKTHGGTLDLISTGYASGENFPVTIAFYFNHLFRGFAYIGIPAGLLGLYSLWKRNRNIAVATLLGWLLAGPVFIYMANMPPNTHALVILEAHFLFPNLIFFIWIYEGFAFFSARRRVAAGVLCAAFAVFNLVQHYPELNKRLNFVAYDYAKNVLRSLPPGSAVVMKKDVQLFSLWNRQYVENDRPDAAVVPQGLSGSEWFRVPFDKIHPGVMTGRLSDPEAWKLFAESNSRRNVYFTGDAEYSKPQGYSEEPVGLVNLITTGARVQSPGSRNDTTGTILLDHIYPYRGKFLYTAYREFFTPDLIEDYAKAYMWTGISFFRSKQYDNARKYLRKAVMFKPLLPQAWNYIAFTYFEEGNNALARTAYAETAAQYEALLELGRRFNTPRDMMDSFSKEYSDALVSHGVACNNIGDENSAFASYGRAIEAYPNNSRAYYNRSVLHWKRGEWSRVVSDLENTVRLEPGFTEAAMYLERAKVNAFKH